jgi:hypothetical protein
MLTCNSMGVIEVLLRSVSDVCAKQCTCGEDSYGSTEDKDRDPPVLGFG